MLVGPLLGTVGFIRGVLSKRDLYRDENVCGLGNERFTRRGAIE